MLREIMNYTFLQNAIISSILASIVCGIMGTIIVEKRLVMMSGGIAHTSFGGIGIAYYMGASPILGAFMFSIIASVSIVTIKRKTKTDCDTLIGILWGMGMAIGILFISMTPGYLPDITSVLFGDILTVSKSDIDMMIFLDITIIFIVILSFNYIKAFLFDEEFLRVIGVNTTLLDYTIFIFIAFSIIVLIRVVGIMLIIILLTIPTSISKFYTYNLRNIMIMSIINSVMICFIGLWISYTFNIASGASIIIIAGIIYFTIAFVKKVNNLN